MNHDRVLFTFIYLFICLSAIASIFTIAYVGVPRAECAVIALCGVALYTGFAALVEWNSG